MGRGGLKLHQTACAATHRANRIGRIPLLFRENFLPHLLFSLAGWQVVCRMEDGWIGRGGGVKTKFTLPETITIFRNWVAPIPSPFFFGLFHLFCLSSWLDTRR